MNKSVIRINANVERDWFEVYEVFNDGGAPEALLPYRYVLKSDDKVFPLYESHELISMEKLPRFFEYVATIYGFDDNTFLYTTFESIVSLSGTKNNIKTDVTMDDMVEWLKRIEKREEIFKNAHSFNG